MACPSVSLTSLKRSRSRHEHCESLAFAQALLQALAEENAVGQIREGIVMRQVRDAILDAPALADILVRRDPTAVRHRLMHYNDHPPIA